MVTFHLNCSKSFLMECHLRYTIRYLKTYKFIFFSVAIFLINTKLVTNKIFLLPRCSTYTVTFATLYRLNILQLTFRYILKCLSLLQIEDHRTELYVGDSVNFPGQGYRLGKQSPIDNLLSASLRRSNNILQQSGCANPSTKDNSFANVPLLSLPITRYYHYINRIEINYLSVTF